MVKIKTIKLQGKDYAQVSERIKAFRNDCPHGSINTEPKIDGDTLIFKAIIVKDKNSHNSADATGHSFGKNSGQKAFEKLETIAVGRALALLGYAGDGEIASGEEMQEFLEYQEQQKKESIQNAIEKLEETKNLDQLKKVWPSIQPNIRDEKEILDLKNKLKEKYASS